MSGGYFDYDQYKIGTIRLEVETLISQKEFSSKTLARFQQAVYHLEMAEIYAQRIDWLVSGDDSEETFHERLNEQSLEVSMKHIFREEIERCQTGT
jgi:hypothetical protein